MIEASADFIPMECVQDGVNTVPIGWTYDRIRHGYAPPTEDMVNFVAEAYEDVPPEKRVKLKPHHGLSLYEFKVMVRVKEVEEKTKGGIILPDAHKDKLAYSATEGELVAVSPLAFTYEKWPDGVRLPEVGDTVVFGKYAGTEVEGADGVKYRILDDKEIIAGRV
jgi:chaperonin GroES